ncbi:MAG: phosphoribosyltransferase [Saprospiraceae bacterium]|nr:phosphoribosyltransferase [Saprospiraceae bacterium]
MKILDHREIKQKIKRLAIQILEHNYDEQEIVLAGINNNGTAFAKILKKELEDITEIPVRLTRIRLNPAAPIEQDVSLELEKEELVGRSVIIVDDVANTGRTIFYAFKPILNILPKKVEVAVLVDREHKSFPIKVDYLGLSLATTLKENIEVDISDYDNFAVFLR